MSDNSGTKTAADTTLPEGIFWRGSRLWISYYGPGDDGHMEQKRESALGPKGKPARTPKEAEKFRKSRLEEVAMHRRGVQPFQGRRAERVLFTELLDAYEQHADVVKRRKSLPQIRSRCKRLREHFAGWRALGVTHDVLVKYVQQRQADGAEPSTINRETEIIGAAFALAAKTGKPAKLAFMPPIPGLNEKGNVRKGFFETAQFEAAQAALADDDLADFIEYLYRTGWRKGEGAALMWADVDVPGGVITLPAEDAKNEHSRKVALDEGLKALIARRAAARPIKGPDGTIKLCELVFHRGGRRIGDIRKAWAAACIKAGLARPKLNDAGEPVLDKKGRPVMVPTKLVHDLRRSAVRDMVRAGAPETVAMSISGHKTRSVFDRYNISSEDDQRRALASTADYRAARPRDAKILVLSTASNAATK